MQRAPTERRRVKTGANQASDVESLVRLRERILFRGHRAILGLHPTTIEVTRDEHLTERGDCIVGVAADKGSLQLSESFKAALRNPGARVTITLRVGTDAFSLTANGDPRLELTNPHDVVIRKSGFVSDRTLAVGASASARDIPRSLVSKLRSPEAVGTLEAVVTL